MASIADLPAIVDLVGDEWAAHLVDSATRLFERDMHGLLRVDDRVVMAFRNDDVRRLAATTAAGNATVEALMGKAAEREVGDRSRRGSGFRPIIENQVFTFNPPQHPPLRRVLTRQMTAGNVQRFGALVDTILAELIDESSAAGEIDVARDIAAPLACRFWGRLIGLGVDETLEMQRLMDVLATVFLVRLDAEQRAALDDGVLAYMSLVERAVARARRTASADPLGAEMLEGMASDLAAIDLPGLPADVGLLAAGNLFDGFHTVGVGVATALYHVLGRPEVAAAVRGEPSRAGAAYDEATRLSAPLTITYRLSLEPIVHDGVELTTGTMIGMHWAGANRDPDVFDDPTTFDLDRPTKHVVRHATTFGGGAHLCPGRNIARFVGERAVAAFTRPDLDVDLDLERAVWIPNASAAQLAVCPAFVRRRPS